jgi:glycosyltransferase involved in cell wall biosynthesis
MHGTIKRGGQGTSNYTRVCFAVGFLQIVALLLLWFRAPPVLHTPQLRRPGLCPCLLGQCRSGGANQGVHDDAVPTCSATAAKIRSPILVVVRPESGESLNKDGNACHTIVRQTLPSLTDQTHWHHAPVNVLVILDPEAPPQQKRVIHRDCAKTNQDVVGVHTVSVPRNRLHTVSSIIHKHARKLAGVKYVAFVDLAVTHPASLASSALEKMVLVLEGKHVDAATALASRYDTPATSTTTTIESKMRAAWLYAHYDGGPIMTRANSLRKESSHIEQWLTAAHAADRYKALATVYHSHPCGARFTIPEILTRSRFADDRRDTRSHEHQSGDDDRACSPMPRSQQRRASSPFRGLAHALINTCFKQQQQPQQQPSVLMILPWLEFGGADEFNVNLARELRKKGVNVVVTTTLVSSHPTADRLQKYATDVFHIPHIVMSADDQPGVLSLWEYVIATRRVELVFLSNSHLGYKMLPHLQTLKNKYEPLRIVDFVHLEEPEQGAKSHAASSLTYSSYLDHTFVASRHLAEWMMERHERARRWRTSRSTTGHRPGQQIHNNKISVTYIGVDTQTLVALSPVAKAEARRRYIDRPTSSTSIVIAYVARMEKQKDPALFFEIARRLATHSDKYVFLAIGDGDLLPTLQRNITGSGLNHKIKTFSMLHHDETMRLLASSDILLLTSRNEGISLATYEAMALGVVPVVTDVGGQCELVDEQVGACLPLTRSVADDFAREISNNIVPRLSSLSIASRRRVETEFSLRETMRSLTQALCASETRGSRSL